MDKISKILGIKNVILTLLLSVMFLDLRSYWYVFAVLPIAYALFYKTVYRLYDKIFVMLFLFGLCYVMFAPSLLYNQYVVFLLICPMMYLVGKHLGKTETESGLVNILFAMALSMAILYIRAIFSDIAQSGFYVESRNLEIEGKGATDEIAATGIYSNLIIMTTFIIALFVRMSIIKKAIYVLGAIMAFVVSIRLQSRTSVVVLGIMVLLFLILNIKTIVTKNFLSSMIAILLLYLSISFIVTHYQEELGVLDRFMDDDAETGGGRFTLAGNVLSELGQHPFGIPYRMPYAHNLWLDCARVAGVIPLFFLLIVTIRFVRDIFAIYKCNAMNFESRSLMCFIGLAILVYMNLEPILEGCPLLFAYFITYLGMLRGVLEDGCNINNIKCQ